MLLFFDYLRRNNMIERRTHLLYRFNTRTRQVEPVAKRLHIGRHFNVFT